MSLKEDLLKEYEGNEVLAAIEATLGLMQGDKATFKAGYSFPNALNAAADLFGLSQIRLCVVAEAVAGRLSQRGEL